MGLHVHEVHAAVIHAPLVLIPTAAAVDLAAAGSWNRGTDRIGRALWWSAVAGGLFAGIAGMAASQEVKAEDRTAEDKMWLHGVINVGVVVGALGIALWRTGHRPNRALAMGGLVASGISFYTAYLGGEMVYTHGLGVKSMPRYMANGVRQSPPLLSAEAPGTFVRDAVKGVAWLFGRLAETLRGRQGIEPRATGVELPSSAPPRPAL